MSVHERGDGGSRPTDMLGRVLGPVGPELSCDQCFELLDRYVDRELAGADAGADVPGMQAHLEGCPACHEDYESLRDFVAGTPAGLGEGDAG